MPATSWRKSGSLFISAMTAPPRMILLRASALRCAAVSAASSCCSFARICSIRSALCDLVSAITVLRVLGRRMAARFQSRRRRKPQYRRVAMCNCALRGFEGLKRRPSKLLARTHHCRWERIGNASRTLTRPSLLRLGFTSRGSGLEMRENGRWGRQIWDRLIGSRAGRAGAYRFGRGPELGPCPGCCGRVMVGLGRFGWYCGSLATGDGFRRSCAVSSSARSCC